MLGFSRLLVATDLSPAGDRALRRIPLLQLAPNARVTVVHVVKEGPLVSRAEVRGIRDELHQRIEELITSHAKWPRGAKAFAQVVPSHERVWTVLDQEARDGNVELVVMGRKGHRLLKKLLLGASTERLARTGRHSILVTAASTSRSYQRPLVAVDFSPVSQFALEYALRLAPAAKSVDLVHAYDRSWSFVMRAGGARVDRITAYDHQMRVLAEQKMASFVESLQFARKLSPLVLGGDPRVCLTDVAQKHRTDVIVLGAHGEKEHQGLGSVADALIRVAECDVCIAAPPRAGERPRR